MKSLNNLKPSLNVLSTSKAAHIKGGTDSYSGNYNNNYTGTTTTSDTSDSAGGPWDNRGKRPGTKG